MITPIKRREFLHIAAGCSAACFGVPHALLAGSTPCVSRIISPGCRRSKVRVGKVYVAGTSHLWPTPKLDLKAEMARYEAEFARLRDELTDVEFVGNQLATSTEDIKGLTKSLEQTDGILVIHLGMGLGTMLNEVLALGLPTVFFAAPYSGHEWTGLGQLQREPEGARLECLLTGDYDQLAAAVRPFRCIHHLREAKIINVSTRKPWTSLIEDLRSHFGTEIKQVGRERILSAYEAVKPDEAEAEAEQWIRQAEKVVEPPRDEIVRSCRLALAFENVLSEEDGTVLTADCYGSMYRQLPAFPCIGFTRLNNMGLGGICESDLRSAMTHILFQGLAGKPGFISDPTMDVSKNAVILAHCLGTTRMDGPKGQAAPYRIRTIMERQEGAVAQVRMRLGQKVTQAVLAKPDLLLYFTGDIIETPDTDRGCRTKITVRIDGDAEKLWRNWSNGLHRVTCYGDLTRDLERFCRYKNVQLMNEAEELLEA